MKDLLEYIVKNIVLKPDSVVIEEAKNDSEVLLTLTVDQEDMGIVIGRMGQVIKAIRKLLAVKAIADSVRVSLELKEPTA